MIARWYPREMGRAAKLALVLGAVLLAGCEPDVASHQVRGVVISVQPEGAALELNHEAVPGAMDAMIMSLPTRDPVSARALEPGDKIVFELIIENGRGSVGHIEALPADTELQLASPPSPT